jgi:predicted transcriptional regulator
LTQGEHIDFIAGAMGTKEELFVAEVEAFLKATGFKPIEFGAQAVGDPFFIGKLRRGRSPTLKTADRVTAFIRRFEEEAAKRQAKGKR